MMWTGITSIAVAILTLWIGIAFRGSTTPNKVIVTDRANIQASCRMLTEPIEWAHELPVIDVQRGIFCGIGGMSTTKKPRLWPPEDKYFFHRLYSCEITNFGPLSAFSIEAEYKLTLQEAILSPDSKIVNAGHTIDPPVRTCQIHIDSLDKNKGTYQFYVYNHSPYFASLTFPEFVTAELEGDSIRTRIRLKPPVYDTSPASIDLSPYMPVPTPNPAKLPHKVEKPQTMLPAGNGGSATGGGRGGDGGSLTSKAGNIAPVPYGVQQIAPGGTGYQANGPNAHAGPIITTPIQRHIPAERLLALSQLAISLPRSASTWLSVETANDPECALVAQEVYDVLHTNGKVASGPVIRMVPEPNLFNIQVVVASISDEHFAYAQQIANILNTSSTQVIFGSPTPPRTIEAGKVKILVFRAESGGVEPHP
jgi:hypothetical protein